MKIKKGFSLADILLTISVVAIIAGVSLGFFKQQEPDRRIFDSTVRQLQFVIAAVNHKACSGEQICYDTANNHIEAPPICPDYQNANDVTFVDNQCSFTPTEAAGAECTADNPPGAGDGNYTYSVALGKCTATPGCNSGALTTYKNIFCPNNTPDLSKQFDDDNTTFFCSQMYDLLNKKSGTTKAAICTNNDHITLSNRARLYGLGSAGTGMQPGKANIPATLLIKYDNPNNPIFDGNDTASINETTSDFVIIYPNGRILKKEDILKIAPNFSIISDISNILTKNEGAEYKTILDKLTSACNDGGANCLPESDSGQLYKTFGGNAAE